ncbi:hypothetical protein B7W85_12695 [Allorhizobium ampelinum]|nr:hypothetical protein B7W85_12695 [Allorhizobium ampelinum]
MTVCSKIADGVAKMVISRTGAELTQGREHKHFQKKYETVFRPEMRMHQAQRRNCLLQPVSRHFGTDRKD